MTKILNFNSTFYSTLLRTTSCRPVVSAGGVAVASAQGARCYSRRADLVDGHVLGPRADRRRVGKLARDFRQVCAPHRLVLPRREEQASGEHALSLGCIVRRFAHVLRLRGVLVPHSLRRSPSTGPRDVHTPEVILKKPSIASKGSARGPGRRGVTHGTLLAGAELVRAANETKRVSTCQQTRDGGGLLHAVGGTAGLASLDDFVEDAFRLNFKGERAFSE